jgi:hypothetical protein
MTRVADVAGGSVLGACTLDGSDAGRVVVGSVHSDSRG